MTSPLHAWRLLLATEGVRTVALTRDEPFALAPGVELTVRGGKLELRIDPRGAPRTLLNGVQIAGFAQLHTGDQVEVPGTTALVQRVSARAERSGPLHWRRDELQARLWSEVARAKESGGRVTCALVRMPPQAEHAEPAEPIAPPSNLHIELATLGPGLFEVMVAGETDAAQRAREAVRRWAEERGARIGIAEQPEDGSDPDSLVATALMRFEPGLSAEDEAPVIVDPASVRLRGWAERLSRGPGNLVLLGERYTGKSEWARYLHPELIEFDLSKPGTRPPAEPDALQGKVVLLLHLDAVPGEAQAEWLDACAKAKAARVIATAEGALADEVPADAFPNEVFVPALRDRPAEILPLATRALERARQVLAKPGLTFNAEVRSALQAYGWPGNVRELRNAVGVAALSAESDELRAANLPPSIVASWQKGRARNGVASEDLRSSLKAAEKDALLKVLARTSWNVSQAAKELGLPRRTVVYRMSRLGLRRPRKTT